MSKMYINIAEVRNANYGIPPLSSQINSIKKAIGLMRYRIPEEVAERYRIKKRMTELYTELEKVEAQIDELYAVTNSCVEQYILAERRNNSNSDAFD